MNEKLEITVALFSIARFVVFFVAVPAAVVLNALLWIFTEKWLQRKLGKRLHDSLVPAGNGVTLIALIVLQLLLAVAAIGLDHFLALFAFWFAAVFAALQIGSFRRKKYGGIYERGIVFPGGEMSWKEIHSWKRTSRGEYDFLGKDGLARRLLTSRNSESVESTIEKLAGPSS